MMLLSGVTMNASWPAASHHVQNHVLLLSGREILHNAEAAVMSLGHENARYNAAKWCPP